MRILLIKPPLNKNLLAPNNDEPLELVNLIKERGIKKRFMMYARTDMIVNHPDLLASLREIGLEYLLVGIESFRDEELKKLNKKVAAQTNIEALRILSKTRLNPWFEEKNVPGKEKILNPCSSGCRDFLKGVVK